jgi:hypothetical protein
MKQLCAATHESGSGTSRTWLDVRLESAFGGKADMTKPALEVTTSNEM